MIHVGIDADLTFCSFEDAYRKLQKITKEMPIGIIVGKNDKKRIDEILSLPDSANLKIKVDAIESLSIDMWILYNDVDAIYSNGA